jgi:cation diffusion facilitator family transporter
VIAFLSVRASHRPADREHPYGHGKIENISGAVEAVLILMAAIFIIHEAVNKLRHPEPISNVLLGVYVMGLSILINIVVSRHLFKVSAESDSIALEADAHHLSTDVWTSMGVFLGMAAIRLTGWHVIDPLVALAVALMIMKVAFSLTWKATAPLLDVRLPDEELAVLDGIVMATSKIVGYHKLRTRKAGPYREIDFHLIVPAQLPVVEAHEIAEAIEDQMRERFPRTHVITHIEPDTADEIGKPDTEVKERRADAGQ